MLSTMTGYSFYLLCCCILVSILLSCNGSEAKGKQQIGVYQLKKGNFSVMLTNYGAVMMSLVLPDKHGKLDDIILGFDSVDEYKNDTGYLGAIVGRVANRIGGAKFTLNGVEYKLVPNEGKNMLHGGPIGFSDRIWKVYSHKPNSHVTFTYNSFDGEQGFPGNLSVAVTYMIIGTNKLGLKMEAKALNKATPVNLALHTYWNLHGHNTGDIFSQTLQIMGSKITPVDDEHIPTGKFSAVKGTPYDFLKPHAIGSMFKQLPSGYDMNYVLDGADDKHLKKAAVAYDSVSGRKMELWTTAPGVQLYTSNFLGHVKGKGGFVYSNYAAFCLETQGFPDSVNHPNFPSTIVNPGETYKHIMVFRFTTKKK